MNSHRKPNVRTNTPANAIRTLLFAIAMAHIAHAQTNTGTGPNVNVATTNGANAALSITTGTYNSAYGSDALRADTTGGYNTALGAVALFTNIAGTSNTGVGYGALYSNTANENTALGTLALGANTSGTGNTASGFNALRLSTTGNYKTAAGYYALRSNTTGYNNTASGYYALQRSTVGHDNTAYGYNALNTLLGAGGSNNIGIGSGAGSALTQADNICIGSNGSVTDSRTIRIGTAGTQTAAYIAGIYNVPTGGLTVSVNANGQLGTVASSRRFKQDIANMDDASNALYSLRPVRFCYKAAIDPKGTRQFGLIAEEVDKVDPELVARDDKGEVYTVRYEAVNAMMLNEFLKEHRRVEAAVMKTGEQAKMIEEQARTIGEQQKQIQALASRLTEISERIERMNQPKTPALQ